MTENEHRLLELLAASEDGATDALLLASDFTLDTMVGLVRAGLMTVKPERTFAAGKPVEITRARITDPGRQALADRGRGDKVFL